ncbi:hypothetical protein OG824_22610 [Streptomyces prunicolor]|uniref:hypothetical protein n=1 Tax=Streptomyces prunicolor TaxID=67348 RepID=UPI00225877ED|nr:hypothetical protein [Streptomyces prunicolor]MCX5237994.1 hypothetical protein [Streptomyces prunicolor]
MTTHFDEGDGEPGRDLDDPLTVILRPSSTEYLGPPTGRYESIRRGANRRRLFRATLGAGATCAVIALVALPFRLSHHDSPTTPTVPLAPPPASGSAPTASPSQAPSATKAPSSTPTASPSSPADVRTPSRTVVPTTEPSRVASEPSAVATQAR